MKYIAHASAFAAISVEVEAEDEDEAYELAMEKIRLSEPEDWDLDSWKPEISIEELPDVDPQ